MICFENLPLSLSMLSSSAFLSVCLGVYVSLLLSASLYISVCLSPPSPSSSLSTSPLLLLLYPSLSSPPPPPPLSLLLTTQAFSSLAESAYELATPEDESEHTYSLSTAFEAIVTKIMETADRSGLYWQAGGNQPSLQLAQFVLCLSAVVVHTVYSLVLQLSFSNSSCYIIP